MKIDTILVPLDGSLLAEAALPKAVELIGTNAKGTLILLRAVEAPSAPGGNAAGGRVSVVREVEEYLERVAARLREDGVSRVKTSVGYGAAARTILEAVRMMHPDLIMMGTCGRSGIGGLVVGSVAEAVSRRTRTPMFLIRVDAPCAEARVERAPTREERAANVSVGVGAA